MMEDYGQCYIDFLNGDLKGFELTVKQYRKNLILFIQQYVRDFSVAEDISQDVFVKLYVKNSLFTQSLFQNMALHHCKTGSHQPFEKAKEFGEHRFFHARRYRELFGDHFCR